MSVGLGMQAFGTGLMALIVGFMLDDKTADVDDRWMKVIILFLSLSLLSWILSALSMYFDKKGGRGGLRAKHVVPAITTEMNEAAGACDLTENRDEQTSLVSATQTKANPSYTVQAVVSQNA